jgi:hypothetical protein
MAITYVPGNISHTHEMKSKVQSFPVIAICMIVFLCSIQSPLYAKQFYGLETENVSVYSDKPNDIAVRQVIELYPAVKAGLETKLIWKVDFKPVVLLVSDRKMFAEMSGSPLIVAYAVPEKMLIVIDFSRMNTEPFTLAATLEHELCHLLLHHYIHEDQLPRWLDEGVCQWVSGGLAEIVTGSRGSTLGWASLSGGFIPFNALSVNFPQDERSLALAYEESRSVVEYIVSSFGKSGLLNILDAMKKGRDVNDAVAMSLGMSLGELERKWQESQRSWTAVISVLVANLYTILFAFGALLTLAVYIRLVIRKRRLSDEEEEE